MNFQNANFETDLVDFNAGFRNGAVWMNSDPSEHAAPSEAQIQDWIRRVKGGDDSFFQLLIETFGGRLQATLYRMLFDWDEARDVAQETFIQGYRSLPRYQPSGTFQSWLFQIGVRKAVDALRRRARNPVLPDPSGNIYATLSEVHGALDPGVAQNELSDAVEKAVAGLPPDQRTAFVLAEYEGFGHREIAAILGGSPKKIEMQIYRARQALRSKLRPFLPD